MPRFMAGLSDKTGIAEMQGVRADIKAAGLIVNAVLGRTQHNKVPVTILDAPLKINLLPGFVIYGWEVAHGRGTTMLGTWGQFTATGTNGKSLFLGAV